MKHVLALVPLALLAACGSSAADPSVGEAPVPIAAVRTAPVTAGVSSEEVTVYGATEAEPGTDRSVSTQADAILVSIPAPSGTPVRAGQVIAILSPSALTRFDSAKAVSDAGLANAALARAIRLRADGLVSNAEVEAARAAVQSANAAQASASQRTGTLVLRAPHAGTVGAMTLKVGDFVPAGTTVASVGQIGNVRARLGIEPALAARIRPGMPVKLMLPGASEPIATVISGMEAQADPATRLLAAYVRIPAGSGLAAGQSLTAQIVVSGGGQGITIPYSALLDDGGRSYVFVVEGDSAKARNVTPGSSSGDRIQIRSGLKPGERVVVEAGTALEDDMQVQDQSGRPAGRAK
jgi:RND family efflux transporter MFP subunit